MIDYYEKLSIIISVLFPLNEQKALLAVCKAFCVFDPPMIIPLALHNASNTPAGKEW